MGKVSQEKNTAQEKTDKYPRSIDLDFLRRELDIETVARLLGLEVNDKHFAHCFRPENHRNGDANPSLHFHKRKNRAFCFICDRHGMSTIDLAMAVLACDFKDALRWFRREFGELPLLRGRPVGLTRARPERVGVGGELEHVLRLGVLRLISEKAGLILFLIEQLRDTHSGKARIPYATIREYAGVASDTTIRGKLDELVAIHIIDIDQDTAKSGKPRNVYQLTPNDSRLLEMLHDAHQQQRVAQDRDSDYYREQKLARRRKPDSLKNTTPVAENPE